MGIYFEEIFATLEFEGESNINEMQFDKKIAKANITVIIRDMKIARGSNTTDVNHGPSIKVKGNGHDKNGDPICFVDDSKPIFIYKGDNPLAKNEEKYLRNFINHNYLNLYNYWYAPRECETSEFAKELQHEIQRRIQTNINKYDYSKGEYNYDTKVEISPKVQQDLMLVYELFDDEMETINEYDENKNIIYSKKWCKPTRSIEYEYKQKFNTQNKLIYFNSIDCNYEEFYDYDEQGNLISFVHKDFSGYSYETIFDDNHRKVKDVDNTGRIIKEYFYENNSMKIINHDTGYTEEYLYHENYICIYHRLDSTIKRTIIKYSDGRLIYDMGPEHGVAYVYDKYGKLVIKHDISFGDTYIYYDEKDRIRSYEYNYNAELSETKFQYDDKNQLIKLEDFGLLGNLCFIIEYENIYEA